jgi:hypothetical protein
MYTLMSGLMPDDASGYICYKRRAVMKKAIHSVSVILAALLFIIPAGRKHRGTGSN